MAWHTGNLRFEVQGDTLRYRGFKIFTENDFPTAEQLGVVARAGDTMTGNLIMDNGAGLIINNSITDTSALILSGGGATGRVRNTGDGYTAIINEPTTGDRKLIRIGAAGVQYAEGSNEYPMLHTGNFGTLYNGVYTRKAANETITGDWAFTKLITGSVSGNAGTANRWAANMTLTLGGDVTGSTSFDGATPTSINVSVNDNSHAHTIANVTGLQAALDLKAPLDSPVFTGKPQLPLFQVYHATDSSRIGNINVHPPKNAIHLFVTNGADGDYRNMSLGLLNATRNAYTYLTPTVSGGLRIEGGSGFVDIMNNDLTRATFITDRPEYEFDKPINVAGYRVYTADRPPAQSELVEQTIRMSHLDSTKFYPIVFQYANTIRLDMSVGGGSAAIPFNNNMISGSIRAGGYTDRYPWFDINYVAYDANENSINSIWRGTTAFSGIVVYVRGGQDVIFTSNANGILYEETVSVGGSTFPVTTSPNGTGFANAAQMINFNNGRQTQNHCSIEKLSNAIFRSPVGGRTLRIEPQHGMISLWDPSTSNASGIQVIKADDQSQTLVGYGTHWNGANNTVTSAFAVGTGNSWYNANLFRVRMDGRIVSQTAELADGTIYTDKVALYILTNSGSAKGIATGGVTISNNYAAVADTPANGLYSLGNIRTSAHIYTTNSEIIGGAWGHSSQGFIDLQNTSGSYAYNIFTMNGGAGAKFQVIGGNNPSTGAMRMYINNSVIYNFTPGYMTIPGYISMNAGHLNIPGGAVTGSYGSLSIAGVKGGWAGIHFDGATRTFMVGTSIQGIHTGSGWQWYFENGSLAVGTVPYARTTGVAAASHIHGGTDVVRLGNKLSVSDGGIIFANDSSARTAGMYGIYDSTKIGHIWSMGTGFKISATGANFGNLYGFAYKYVNNTTGGTMADGHQAVWCQNGTPTAAIGNGIWTSGNVAAYSDIRVKYDLEVIPNASDKLMQVNGYTYRRSDLQGDDALRRHMGVVAQEFLKIAPEMVTGGPTPDNPDGHYSVAYGNGIAILIEAHKENRRKIDRLTNENLDLKYRLQKLEAQVGMLIDVIGK
ncbi:long tail fiber protein distal subunit [Vibrio phage EniLVp02]